MSPDAGAGRAARNSLAGSTRWSYYPVALVLVIGLAVTAVLAVVSHSIYDHNQRRLLDLRAKEAEQVLTAAVPGIQTPLASAAALADATHGNVRKFRRFIVPYVGRSPQQPFISASLWRLGNSATVPRAVVGVAPELTATQANSFLPASAHRSQLSVLNLLGAALPRLGYAFGGTGRFVVYAESGLPRNRRETVRSNAAFSDLDIAIYLGHTTQPADLLVTTVDKLPLPKPISVLMVRFGTGAFTLVVAARRSLSGSLPRLLPVIIAVAGALLTALAALLTSRLLQRRRRAEHLATELERIAAENRRLYAEQRDIARTLQHALLPDSLPVVPGLESAGHYLAGEEGMEIGGDWYDVIPLSERCVLMAVGDVSGRGLRAAATMASLRFAIHAYAVQHDSPTEILSKLSRLLSVVDSGQIATVLCVTVDLDNRRLTLASAGHLPPLLVLDGRSEYLRPKVGLPIGVEQNADYEPTTVTVADGGILLAFTDGLVERKHESIDEGLARLRRVATTNHVPLPELLTFVLGELSGSPSQDDTAIVGVRWTS